MDTNYQFPPKANDIANMTAATNGALTALSPDRVNQQRFDLTSSEARARLFSPGSPAHSRESSVHEKAAKFETLAFQGKQLERRANDAALKRAMLGREEAESEMRRYRDEARGLRKVVEEGKERERKVGERLEQMMENYGRAKETHAHTQTLWEKEIRRARKEAFKSQSAVVKLQEELQSLKKSLRKSQAETDEQKERANVREQEAFAARYELVGLQEELVKAREMIKLVEQERDALRTVAKNEEVARIAAEGQIPLPRTEEEGDEFASPRKVNAPRRVSVMSSLASEEEIETLKERLEWEAERADRAWELAEFLQTECGIIHKRSSTSTAQSSPSPAAEPAPEQNLQYIPSEGIFRNVAIPSLAAPASPAQNQDSPWISPAKVSSENTQSTHLTTDEPLISFGATPARPSTTGRTPSTESPSASRLDGNASFLSILDAPPSPTHSEGTVVRHSIAHRSPLRSQIEQVPEADLDQDVEMDGMDLDVDVYADMEEERQQQQSRQDRREERQQDRDEAMSCEPGSAGQSVNQQSYQANFEIASRPINNRQSFRREQSEIPSDISLVETSHYEDALSRPQSSRQSTIETIQHQIEERDESRFHTVSTTRRIPINLPPDNDDDLPTTHTETATHHHLSHPPSQPQAHRTPSPLTAPQFQSLSNLPHLSASEGSSAVQEFSPTMTREEALAMIRERRGRARSMHAEKAAGGMTPRKGVSGDRHASAASAPGTGPRSVSRGRLVGRV